jgi:protein-arginine kinase activator protein McsA
MNCQRCSSTRGGLAVAQIRGEILNLKICGSCAQEAADWGLRVEPLQDLQPELATMRIPAAA